MELLNLVKAELSQQVYSLEIHAEISSNDATIFYSSWDEQKHGNSTDMHLSKLDINYLIETIRKDPGTVYKETEGSLLKHVESYAVHVTQPPLISSVSIEFTRTDYDHIPWINLRWLLKNRRPFLLNEESLVYHNDSGKLEIDSAINESERKHLTHYLSKTGLFSDSYQGIHDGAWVEIFKNFEGDVFIAEWSNRTADLRYYPIVVPTRNGTPYMLT